ncbi:MAG TPA: non-ribosomal peptide synthetase, partial [Hymenobacter sp.]
NVVNFLCSMRQEPGISAADKLLAITTVSFDIAGLELFLPLLNGAIVLLADAATVKDGKLLLELIKREKVTILQATPATWRMLLDSGWTNKLPLKALCGGEALPAELAERLIAKCESVWNMYGPTETTIWSSVKHVLSAETPITVGKPIANTQFYVLDEYLKPVEPGKVGELIIAGDGVAQGYLGRPELTAEKFIANPFAAQAGATMYRTGDLGKLLETGEIQCLGRIDQQVKIRGYRIELGEIEHALMGFDNVKEAVVVACEERPGHGRLVAYIVPAAAVSLQVAQQNTTAWKKSLARQLPMYMVPSEFAVLSALPMTLNGKVDRKALVEQPKAEIQQAEESYLGARTDMEKLVTSVWGDCLGIEKISIDDNFFELGGHSLIAVQVMARLEQETGTRLPLATLFEHSTIEKLASLLETDKVNNAWDSLVPIKPTGSKMPLYVVHGAGMNVLIFNALAKYMDAEQPVYGLQAKGLNGVDEPLDSIEEVAAHYVAAITASNPHGPYALSGYSFGGIIAFEMAKQLLSAGKAVKMLALFDTYAYPSYSATSASNRKLVKAQYYLKKILYTSVLLAKHPIRTMEYKADTLKRLFLKPYWTMKYGKKRQYEMVSGLPYKLGVKNDHAVSQYRLAPYPVAIDLFRVATPTYYMHDFEFLGWKPFALKGITIHEIPGEHSYMFKPPNDEIIARSLQALLNK